MEQIILASQSPRRKELFSLLPYSFEIDPSNAEELLNPKLSPVENVMELASIKAQERAKFHKNNITVGCDTIVVADDVILGKPKNHDDAVRMLKSLSARAHSVYTGVCIVKGYEQSCFFEETKVFMRKISDEEIESYVKSGEPDDKAGAYAIQGGASLFITKIEGDYFNVVGLPVCRLYSELKKFIEK